MIKEDLAAGRLSFRGQAVGRSVSVWGVAHVTTVGQQQDYGLVQFLCDAFPEAMR